MENSTLVLQELWPRASKAAADSPDSRDASVPAFLMLPSDGSRRSGSSPSPSTRSGAPGSAGAGSPLVVGPEEPAMEKKRVTGGRESVWRNVGATSEHDVAAARGTTPSRPEPDQRGTTSANAKAPPRYLPPTQQRPNLPHQVPKLTCARRAWANRPGFGVFLTEKGLFSF